MYVEILCKMNSKINVTIIDTIFAAFIIGFAICYIFKLRFGKLKVTGGIFRTIICDNFKINFYRESSISINHQQEHKECHIYGINHIIVITGNDSIMQCYQHNTNNNFSDNPAIYTYIDDGIVIITVHSSKNKITESLIYIAGISMDKIKKYMDANLAGIAYSVMV